MRKHKDEMIRFAETEEGTAVWYKYGFMAGWGKEYSPTWDKKYTYIVDDEYAEIRKKSHDTGRPIQTYNPVGIWETFTGKLQFNGNIKYYRLEPEEFEVDANEYKTQKDAFKDVKYGELQR